MARDYDFDPERHKFVVTIDHSYYPDVSYCATREEADAIARKLFADDGANIGNSYDRRPAIVVAEIRDWRVLAERDELGRHVGEVAP